MESSVQTLSIVSSIHTSNTRRPPGELFVADRGQIGHQQVGDDGADIETHRSVEREFGIDHDRRVLGHHDRAGVKVAVDQRFQSVQKFQLEARNRGVHIEVLAELGGGGVEPRLCPAVLLGHPVGIREDQVLGDLAERMVAGERRDPLLLPGGGNARSDEKNNVRAKKPAMSPTKFG